MKNIILIGFMGVGKGSVAREVIKHSDYIAIDTDDLIESMENKTIKKVFEQSGEEHFRSLEKKLASWLESSVENTLISTGGGFYKQKLIKSSVLALSSFIDWIYVFILHTRNFTNFCINIYIKYVNFRVQYHIACFGIYENNKNKTRV